MKARRSKIAAMGLVATFCLGSSLEIAAQEAHFDDFDAKKAIIEPTIYNGKPAFKNAYGEVLETNRVYEMSLQERIDRGYTTKVTAANATDLKSDGNESENGPKFNLTFMDVVKDNGRGFDDPQLGESRRLALAKAFAYYSNTLTNSGEADIEIQESSSSGSGAFANSASYFFSSPGFNDPLVALHLINGYDPAGGVSDGYIQFNFGYNYNYNTSAYPTGSQYDFYTVALHEILHLLGFTSFCGPNGVSQAPGNPNVFTSFDKNLMILEDQPFYIVSGSGSQTIVSVANPSYVTNNQMLYKANEGYFAPVHSPSGYNGSSIDHFDNSRGGNGEFLMHPSLSKGHKVDVLDEREAYVLQQLGYSVNFSMATSVQSNDFLDISATIFPNPAPKNGAINVNIGGGIGNKEILVVVYDMMGRQAYSKVVITEGDGVITAVDPYHNLAPGMYIVIGSAKDELFNQKLMILGEDGKNPYQNR